MRLCVVEGCQRKHDAKGYCSAHYQRWKAHGDPVITIRRGRGTCRLAGCNRPHAAKGLCQVHYYRERRSGNPGSADIKTPQPRNGRFVMHGYVFILMPDHPRASRGYVREHIVVMESKLGRELLPGEEVHHINGVKADNRPENLELWVVSQPKGQRPADLVIWAREILRRYG